MGCGTALARSPPTGLGMTKIEKNFTIKTLDAQSKPITTNVTIDFSQTEEENMLEIGTKERIFPIHYCVMKGLNPRKIKSRACKDSFCIVSRENNLDFAVCVVNGIGKEGKQFAALCKDILKLRIEEEFFLKLIIPDEDEIKEKLSEILLFVDKKIAFEKKCDFQNSGCSLGVVLHFHDVIYSANVGNSSCFIAQHKDIRKGASRGGISSAAGSEMPVSNISGNSGFTARTSNFATTNPMKAVAFLYKAVYPLIHDLYGGHFSNFNMRDLRKTQIDFLTTDHSVSSYDELLRLSTSNGVENLPYYARPFKLYLDPLNSMGLDKSSEWPGLKDGRIMGFQDARKLGVQPKPSISSRKLNRMLDKYIVLATTGLWSIVESIEVSSLIEHFIVPESRSATRLSNQDPSHLNSLENIHSQPFPKNINLAKVVAANAKFRAMLLASTYGIKANDIVVFVIGLL